MQVFRNGNNSKEPPQNLPSVLVVRARNLSADSAASKDGACFAILPHQSPNNSTLSRRSNSSVVVAAAMDQHDNSTLLVGSSSQQQQQQQPNLVLLRMPSLGDPSYLQEDDNKKSATAEKNRDKIANMNDPHNANNNSSTNHIGDDSGPGEPRVLRHASSSGGGSFPATTRGAEAAMLLAEELWASADPIFFAGGGSRLNWLLLLGPLAVAGDSLRLLGEATCFALSGVALIPCAERLSWVTEQVAEHTNGTIGALLNATFGNAPELLISVAALRSGYYRVVQLAMLGSMLTNMILVFGVACIVGGLRWQVQELRLTSGNVSVGMLLVATAGSLFPAILILSGQFPDTHSSGSTATALVDPGKAAALLLLRDKPSQEEITLSRVNAAVMFFLYLCYLVFQLGTHKDEFDDHEEDSYLREPAAPNVFCRGAFSKMAQLLSRGVSEPVRRLFGEGRTVGAAGHRSYHGSVGVLPKKRSSDLGGFANSGSADVVYDPCDNQSSDSDDDDEEVDDDDAGEAKGLIHIDDSDEIAIGGAMDDEEAGASAATSFMDVSEQSSSRRRKIGAGRLYSPSPLTPNRKITLSPRVKRQVLASIKSKSSDAADGLSQEGGEDDALLLPDGDESFPLVSLQGGAPAQQQQQHPRAHRHKQPQISMRVGIIWLFVITLYISAMSDILVETIDGFAERMQLSEVFTSMVVIPFFSNVAEQVSAFIFAYRNEMDLCVGVTIGSAIQIATFVLPGSVLIGMVMDRSMTLYFHSYETACLFFGTVLVAAVLQGGSTNWFVGVMLVGVYIMFAAGIWFHEIENLSVDAEDSMDIMSTMGSNETRYLR